MGQQETIWLTGLWAEKMEFMTGMYEFDASGETEKMSMRGSGWSRSLHGN